MNPNETPLGVLAFLALFAAAVAVAHYGPTAVRRLIHRLAVLGRHVPQGALMSTITNVTAAETFSSRSEPRTVTFAPWDAATWRDAICGVVTVVAPIDPRLCDPLNEIGGRMDAISAVAGSTVTLDVVELHIWRTQLLLTCKKLGRAVAASTLRDVAVEIEAVIG